jgi:ATP-independent RNA helicase DbpA
MAASEVGRIDIFDSQAYVAIARSSAGQALACLGRNRIKGRFFRVRSID